MPQLVLIIYLFSWLQNLWHCTLILTMILNIFFYIYKYIPPTPSFSLSFLKLFCKIPLQEKERKNMSDNIIGVPQPQPTHPHPLIKRVNVREMPPIFPTKTLIMIIFNDWFNTYTHVQKRKSL